MSKKVLGLDIGITSVGWAVVDLETSKVVDLGVRLFQEGDPEENLTRRTRRSGRRLKSRRTNRLDDAKEYLKSIGIEEDKSITQNPYELRVKGLQHPLTGGEFYCAYMHLVKRRGSSLESIEDEQTSEDQIMKHVLAGHDIALNDGKFPCQIQLEKLNKGETVRGIENNFRTKHYTKELEAILGCQSFDTEVNERLIELLNRRRRFDEGPGSLKSPTHYGRFIPQKDGSVMTINLIEKMIGKCSVYPSEIRAPKLAPSAEIYNFLNDLNNISIRIDAETTRKITPDEKKEILETFVFGVKHSITPKGLAKYLGVAVDDIKGFRINKSEKPLLTEFPGLKAISKVLELQPYTNHRELYDDIAGILTREKNLEGRIQTLKKECSKYLSESSILALANLKGFNAYHSLSLKIIYEVYDEQLDTDQNFMQIMAQRELIGNNSKDYVGQLIPTQADNIYSPVARRSVSQALSIVNAARHKFGEFDSIVIEMPRDRNSSDQKKREKEAQKKNEIRNQKIKDMAGEHLTGKQKLKISLYLEQEGKCLYTGKPIDLRRLLEDETAYEIDHIIPLSISFDDSFNNKTLVTRKANQLKGQKSPYEAFDSHGMGGWSKEYFYTNALNLMKNRTISSKKFSNLVFDQPTNSIDTLKRFIQRNLVDTQYSSRAVLNTLQSYFKANDLSTKVLTIRGSVTHQFRKRIQLPKDREADYSHHAIDAALIALMSKKHDIYKIIHNVRFEEGALRFDDTMSVENDKPYFDSDYIAMISQIRNIDRVKYSHKVDKKPNRKISDDTIYSTRMRKQEGKEEEYIIKKYKDIYSDEGLKLAKKIIEGKGIDLLMYHNDRQTYDILEAIVNTYISQNEKLDKENPFLLHRNEHGPIQKYSKKGNGPNIKSVKYYDSKLGNHIDITGNQKTNKRIILLQISPYRTDFYQREDGTYGFVTVRYKNIRYSQVEEKYNIDPTWYESEKSARKLSDAKFIFSLHRGELIRIRIEDKTGCKDNIWRFIGTNSDARNVVEVKPITYYEQNRCKPPIGKKVTYLEKYHTDILGNRYRVIDETLKLSFK